MSLIALAKYHALGNDFLVQLEAGAAEAPPLAAADAKVVCERRTGVGADGLIVLRPLGGGRHRMQLWNADGTAAETSGNGLRCAALALFDEEGEGAGSEVVIETAAGPAAVRLEARLGSTAATLRVEMGQVEVGDEGPLLLGRRSRRVRVGNPHLVLFTDPDSPRPAITAVALAHLEHGADGSESSGLNVEAVALRHGRGGEQANGRDLDEVDLVVWERGAGATKACGSGSVASAAALRAVGLVGDRVLVHNPGGSLLVELTGDPAAPAAALTGPAQRVARLTTDPQALRADSVPAVRAEAGS